MKNPESGRPVGDRSIAEQIEENLSGSRLRILIIGAGIAGATLGALLHQRGERPAIIERGSPDDPGGYMLGLMPLGGRVLNGLGLNQPYVDASLPMRDYVLHDRNGKQIRRYPLASLVEKFGRYGGILRGDLLDLLRGASGEIRYEATVIAIDQNAHGATVTFDDGSHVTVDLLVAADGIHSTVRKMVLRDDEVQQFDTGWSGFVFWAPLEGHEPDAYRELWSAGWGIGMYPVPGAMGVFLAGRSNEITGRDPHEYADEIARKALPEPFRRALGDRQRGHAFLWRMADIRSKLWWRDRTVFLGDAATAFLPTAGVGASVAMDSAAALSDELSRADPEHLDYALSLYERRQRHRAELAQKNSRDLARYMFLDRPLSAFVRDQLMRLYTIKQLVRDISKVMEGA
jgi:2-polyprenyl-6-methoxyphenol hydroxylase-like FAD-dependent oxidoreductase